MTADKPKSDNSLFLFGCLGYYLCFYYLKVHKKGFYVKNKILCSWFLLVPI